MKLLHQATFGTSQPMFSDDELRQIRRNGGLRRADRFTTIAVATVLSPRAAFPLPLPEDTALVTATTFGPLATTFQVLDDILDFPEEQLRPANFSHSVINAAASYLGVILSIHGPVFAITGFDNVPEEARALAQTLLDARLAPAVLVVLVDEASLLDPHLPHCAPERFPVPPPENSAAFLYAPE